jgi:hypothetical protein
LEVLFKRINNMKIYLTNRILKKYQIHLSSCETSFLYCLTCFIIIILLTINYFFLLLLQNWSERRPQLLKKHQKEGRCSFKSQFITLQRPNPKLLWKFTSIFWTHAVFFRWAKKITIETSEKFDIYIYIYI